jgi:hypothetical protein
MLYLEKSGNPAMMRIYFFSSQFQMLKGIIIPLVIPSLIVAVGTLDIGLSGNEIKQSSTLSPVDKLLR